MLCLQESLLMLPVCLEGTAKMHHVPHSSESVLFVDVPKVKQYKYIWCWQCLSNITGECNTNEVYIIILKSPSFTSHKLTFSTHFHTAHMELYELQGKVSNTLHSNKHVGILVRNQGQLVRSVKIG